MRHVSLMFENTHDENVNTYLESHWQRICKRIPSAKNSLVCCANYCTI